MRYGVTGNIYGTTVENLCTLYASKTTNDKLAVYNGKTFVLIPSQAGIKRYLCLFLEYVNLIKEDPITINGLKTQIRAEVQTIGFKQYFEHILDIN